MNKEPCQPMIGADVEMFLYDRDKDSIAPCVGIIAGTKDNPYVPEGYMKGFAMQEDNVMLEYNIPPALSVRTWNERFKTAFMMIEKELGKKYGYRIEEEFTFMNKDLRSQQAQTIGCDPDYDAYEGGERRIWAGVLGNERTCGGHIHLGGDFNCPDFVAALFADLFIGCWGNTRSKKSTTRTAWYGKPGIFRSKPYGIEYRTPSNAWTQSTTSVIEAGKGALAEWLTQSEAGEIRRVFKAINWMRIKDYMTPPLGRSRMKGDMQRMYREILIDAQRAGAPLI
jgi:hypothetical protein